LEKSAQIYTIFPRIGVIFGEILGSAWNFSSYKEKSSVTPPGTLDK